ncbi:helix-turn-helix domain-containing protein [Leptospira bourretii]|uniref:Helix-turn-helix domain-containing protein n=1 Tax=Leptospira bourretii TaxID=2484962 RepID=A0A4R9III9_9LEPT|nr:helix-turn-helix domain-containing protein [Leptospira bourretii]TGK88282.1 helix-turn-helix domain-containing protein [Leptospira bourretii]TGK88932.1 helix-turn-helix domain-containing protein [Leptospira bourretii]TGL21221.1 helix-turn-helix domain-containing protein [Leptospira bourretii]TGL26368.1 helix-turn-helix domain-containing protein [Leptospira bourretii]
MKILILEDEPVHAKFLTKLLHIIFESAISEIKHVTSIDEADKELKQSPTNLLFLDLNIFGFDGFDILERIPTLFTNTIVVSANTDNAIRAFEYGVIDFIPKPISEDRLRLALERHSLFASTYQRGGDQQKYTKSRLLQVDLERVQNRLSHLMEIEKIYLNEDLSLEVLAEELELHPRQLSEFLNGKKQTTFNSFLHSYRIKEAKDLLLKYPEKNVSEIGFEVGYKSLSSFYDAFKKELKITASEFRQKTSTSDSI